MRALSFRLNESLLYCCYIAVLHHLIRFKMVASQAVCPQAGQAFTFLLQPKKVNKKGRRCR